MHAARAVSANRGKEVIAAEADEGIFELAAIASEEDGAGAGSIPDTEDIALFQDWTKGGGGKRVVVAFVTIGMVCDGVTAHAG